MGESNDRLRQARGAAHFDSASAAAERFGWVKSTYLSHENGQTPVPVRAADKYAQAFRVSAAWILTGEGRGPLPPEALQPPTPSSVEMTVAPGERIRAAREARRWSAADLARHSGVSEVLIQKIERGQTRHSKFLPRIAKELSLDIATLDLGLAGAQAEEDPIPERRLLAPGRDLPVHAAAEGGPGQIIVSSDPVDFMARPMPLLNTSGAYGLLVVGTSMEPEYRQGDTALINPNLPVIGGEVYIFYAEREGEARATIKHLRRSTVDTWLVLQHNPPDGDVKEFTLSRKEWQWAHRVIGKYSRI